MILLLLACCAPREGRIDRTTDEGVEVVLNHLEPYKMKGAPSRLVLEKKLAIDTENEEIARIGLTEMETFDVDAEGNIYIIRWQSNENYVFKFDQGGHFVTSFLRRGQGPGELEWGGKVLVNHDGNLLAKDPSKPKFAVYDRDGRFVNEVILKKNIEPIAPLANNEYFAFDQVQDEETLHNSLGICDSSFQSFQEIYYKESPNPFSSSEAKITISGPSLIYGAGKEKLYIGDTGKGYEIRVYDLEGRLLNKIRKDYTPVPISEEFKQAFLKRFPEGHPLRGRFAFSEAWPPFLSFGEDQDGRLLVRTYEKGLSSDENIFDIFTPEGVFTSRVSITNRDAHREQTPLPWKCQGDRLYSIHDKENGFRELTVFRLRWE